MSNEALQAIVDDLARVSQERQRRTSDPALQRAVDAVKLYQQRRFRQSYADLAASPRYARAIRFFLEDLYGPKDFSRRDAEFGRVVPGIVRLFPGELSQAIRDMARLHALSETLDTQMAQHLGACNRLDGADYLRAWQLTGQASARDTQIELVLALGAELDRLTRRPLLRGALRAMRLPARRAGFAELQGFLEEGFGAFHAMRGADEFLATVAQRERAFAKLMFSDRGSNAQ